MNEMTKIVVGCLLALLALPVNAQTIRKVGDEPITPGNLVVLRAEGVEHSRLIWDLRYPDEFEQYTERGDEMFIAMPKVTIGVSLFVIPNDVNEPAKKVRYTLRPDTEVIEPDEPEQPEEPTDPPESDMWEGLAEYAAEQFKAVGDPVNGKQLGENYLTALNRFGSAKTFQDALKLTHDARSITFLNLPGQNFQWNDALMKVSGFMSKKNPSPTVAEYEAAMRIIANELVNLVK